MEGDCLMLSSYNHMYNVHIIFEQEFRCSSISVKVLELKDPNTLKYKHSKVNINIREKTNGNKSCWFLNSFLLS